VTDISPPASTRRIISKNARVVGIMTLRIFLERMVTNVLPREGIRRQAIEVD
jgi:hypothetical protein